MPDFNTKLGAYVDGWRSRTHPFVRATTAEQILKKANRPKTPNPRH
ncbi:hypothetical protein RB608_16040 [Nocardioides sp. LHD-245]|nr:hypothetical protein [Nocardioides sp. LHD-245]